jgi:predicted small secreted protein
LPPGLRILRLHNFRRSPLVRKILLILATGSMAMASAACNTVKGLGRDIQSVGEAGDRAIK